MHNIIKAVHSTHFKREKIKQERIFFLLLVNFSMRNEKCFAALLSHGFVQIQYINIQTVLLPN